MAAGRIEPRISVEEYLRTEYRPDCDYVDGIIEERSLGERDHSDVQSNLVSFFRSRFRVKGYKAWVEWRFQTSPTRFRVPDLVLTRGTPAGQILRTAPVLCVEILSPEDRKPRLEAKIREYLRFGVGVVWMISPAEKNIWIYRSNEIVLAIDPIQVDGTEIVVPFSEIFD